MMNEVDCPSELFAACRFDNVRVPLDGLLDRYASVSADGAYSSPIPTVGARFGTMASPHSHIMLASRSCHRAQEPLLPAGQGNKPHAVFLLTCFYSEALSLLGAFRFGSLRHNEHN